MKSLITWNQWNIYKQQNNRKGDTIIVFALMAMDHWCGRVLFWKSPFWGNLHIKLPNIYMSINRLFWYFGHFCPHPRRPRGSHSGREKRRHESFHYGRKSPWVPTLTGPFPKIQAEPAPDWAQKMLCIIVPNRQTHLNELFSCVRTWRLLSRSRLV